MPPPDILKKIVATLPYNFNMCLKVKMNMEQLHTKAGIIGMKEPQIALVIMANMGVTIKDQHRQEFH